MPTAFEEQNEAVWLPIRGRQEEGGIRKSRGSCGEMAQEVACLAVMLGKAS